MVTLESNRSTERSILFPFPNRFTKTLFPLGINSKVWVKEMAYQLGMEFLAKKPEDMGICFIGEARKRDKGESAFMGFME